MNSQEIQHILSYISAHDRETWIRVGMALKSEMGDQGFPIFNQWSSTASNYDKSAVRAVWRSFRGKGITKGSLVYLARNNGWRRFTRNNNAYRHSKSNQINPGIISTQNYALRLWRKSNKEDSVVAEHKYAKTKGIEWAAGAGRVVASGSVIGNNTDCISVPVRNIESDIVQAAQCINHEGKKQTFGPLSNGCLVLGNTLDWNLTWYVCEGWASAVSMVFHHQNGSGISVVSFGKQNLERVANAIDRRFRPSKIVILVEDDS